MSNSDQNPTSSGTDSSEHDETPASSPAGWYAAGVAGEERYWDGGTWTNDVRPSVVDQSANSTETAAGWYADPNVVGTERYWDGTVWTAQTRSIETVQMPSAEEDAKQSIRPWYKRKVVLIPAAALAGVIVLSGVVNAVNGGGRELAAADRPVVTQIEEADSSADVEVPDTTGLTAKEAQALLENAGFVVEFSASEGVVIDRDNWTVLSTVPSAGAAAKSGDTVVVNVEKTVAAAPVVPEEAAEQVPVPAPAPDMSLAQKNAVGSAQSYLSYTGFSRAGLAQQLTSEYGEGFLPEDAEFAIAYLEQTGQVDWNAEAVESAKSYLDYSSFSRQGLFEQLTSEYGEQFTADQANHALNQIGL